MQNFVCIFLLIFSFHIANATTYAWYSSPTVARSCPVIVKGEKIGIESQNWDNQFSLNVVNLIRVRGVLKNIISDLSIKEGDIIKVSYSPDPDAYRYGIDSVEFKKTEAIWMLNLDSNGKFRLSEHPAFRTDLLDEDTLRQQGAFAPLNVDGEAKPYTLSEWRKLSYSFRYAISEEPDERPKHWPANKSEAVEFILEKIDSDCLMSLYPETIRYFFLKETFDEMGLPEGLSATGVNKQLLRDLGRVDTGDARGLLFKEFKSRYFKAKNREYLHQSGDLERPSVRRNKILHNLKSIRMPLRKSKDSSLLSIKQLAEELKRKYNEVHGNECQIKIQLHEDFLDNTNNKTTGWHRESVSSLEVLESIVRFSQEGSRYGFFIDLDSPTLNKALIRVECLPSDYFRIGKH